MRRVVRRDLVPETQAYLDDHAKRIGRAKNKRRLADRLWRKKAAAVFRSIRAELRLMTLGADSCMYCDDSEGTDIEHFWPKGAYPEKAFAWSNYLLACCACNSNCKRTRFPLDPAGRPLLIEPASEEPFDHLNFSPTVGLLVPSTEKGKISIEVYGLNRARLVKGRQRAWASTEALIIRYDHLCASGQLVAAERFKTAIVQAPFASVFLLLIRMVKGPGAALIHDDCLVAIRARPEIVAWADALSSGASP